MKKILFTLFLALAAVWTLSAAPAHRGRIVRTQPDGSTIVTYLHGDEFGHWVTDEQGNVLVQGLDGYWKPSATVSPQTTRRKAAMRRSAANQRRRAAARASAHTGSPRIPVFLIGFKDKSFTKTAAEFDALLNKEGYAVGGAVGSVLDYYKENSLGAFTPVFDVFGPVRLDTTMAYYGANDAAGNDLRPEMALVHAIKKLDADIDFSRYDNDGDGEVDFVLYYFAGYDEAQGGSRSCIWSHAWYLSDSDLARDSAMYDGVRIENYFCTAELDGYRGTELCRIGTTCHEFAHTLGLPDFYDADYSDNGNCAHTYELDVMSEGTYNNDGHTPPYFNAEELWEVGWLPEIPEFNGAGPYSLPAVNRPGASSYAARKLPTSTPGEYFLFEVRGGERWDAPIPEGLLVYHVDRSSRIVFDGSTALQAWEDNTVNNYAIHPCCYIVPASDPGSTVVFLGEAEELFFPYGGKATRFLPTDWEGVVSEWFLDGISYADGRASWELTESRTMAATGYSYIADPGEGEYHAGDSFPLTLVTASGDKAPSSEVLWSLDGEPVSGTAVTLTAGSHSLEASFRTRSGSTKKVLLELDVR